MAVDEIFSVTTTYSYLGETMQNRFYYLQTLGPAGAALLGSLIEDDIMPPVQAIQSDDVTYSFIVTLNLDDTGDFDTIAFGGLGQRTGDGMPPFTSWGYKLISSDRVLRAGGKRFGGVSETDVTDGVADAGVITALQGVANVLWIELADGPEDNTWIPVLHRPAVAEPAAPAITVSISGSPYMRVTTQSSRKFA